MLVIQILSEVPVVCKISSLIKVILCTISIVRLKPAHLNPENPSPVAHPHGQECHDNKAGFYVSETLIIYYSSPEGAMCRLHHIT